MSFAQLAVSAGAGAGAEAWAAPKVSAHMSPISEVRDTTTKTSAAAADDRERSASRSVSPPFLPSLSWRRHRMSTSDSSSISSRLSLATGSITSTSPPPSSSLSPTYTDSSYDQHVFMHANPWVTSKPGSALGRNSTTSPLASPITLSSVGDEHTVPSPDMMESEGAMESCPSSRTPRSSFCLPAEACGPNPQLYSREPLTFPYRPKRRNRESWDSALGSDMNGRRTRGSSLAGPDFQPLPAVFASRNNMLPPPPREANRLSISSIPGSVIHIDPHSPAPRLSGGADDGHDLQACSPQEQCDETSSETTLPAEDAAGRILNYALDVAFGTNAYNIETSSVCRSVVHNFISDLGWAVDQGQHQQREDVVDDLQIDLESPHDADGRGEQQQQHTRSSPIGPNNAQRAGKRRSAGGRGKRKSQELSDDEQDGEDSNDEGDARQSSEPGPSKRVKPNPAVRMSCPYRVKNPLRFNVRDHRLCALTVFTDTAELRRHIQDCHKRLANSPYRCLRCEVQFDSMESLREHQKSTTPCPVNPAADAGGLHNPEDGIDSATANQLKCKRGRVADSIEVQWYKIWCLLFPDCEVQPYDYCAVMEHHELKEKYLGSMCSLNKSLSVIGLGERGLETLDRILTNHFIGLFEQCNEEGRSKDYRNRQPKAAPAQQQQQQPTPDDNGQLRKQSSLRKRLAAAQRDSQRDSGFVEDYQSIVGGLQEAGVVAVVGGSGASSSEEGGGGGGGVGKFTPPATFISDNGSSSSPGASFRKAQQMQFALPPAGPFGLAPPPARDDNNDGVPAGFPPAGPFAGSLAGLDASLLEHSDDASWAMHGSFADYDAMAAAAAGYGHAAQLGHGGFGFPVHPSASRHIVPNMVPMQFAGGGEMPDALQDSTSAWVYSQHP
ncbi:hypothetical protein RB597_007283 [Gaeumannomyces tritici]